MVGADVSYRSFQLLGNGSLQSEEIIDKVDELFACTPSFCVRKAKDLIASAFLANFVCRALLTVVLFHAPEQNQTQALKVRTC